VRDVIKIYKTEPADIVALRGVNLSLSKGEIAVITGPSGSGKTTLLNVVAGLEEPSAGSVSVDDIRIVGLGDRELAEYRRNMIGYVFQSFNLVSFLTVRQNVVLPMYLTGASGPLCESRSDELLRTVDLENRSEQYPRSLSGGEQQKAAIAIALCNNPPVILADEPTAELDTAAGGTILSLLAGLSRTHGKTVIIVSHDLRANAIGHARYRITDVNLSPFDGSHPQS